MRDGMETLLKFQTNRLPRTTVSPEQTRYPISPADMRAFLDTFFARHYFQVQNSMLDYMTSEDFLELLDSHVLNILDIGSGPAVASLAITDVVACILKHLCEMNSLSNDKRVRIRYVLNDTANICLGTGRDMIRTYFAMNRRENLGLFNEATFTIEKEFPACINQLKRISRHLDTYTIMNFSYVINPLNEEQGLKSITNGLAQVETICNPNGRILILQDKFSEALIKKVSGAIRQPFQRDVLSQYVYSTDNDNVTYAYSYYCCLFKPGVSNVKTGAVSI